MCPLVLGRRYGKHALRVGRRAEEQKLVIGWYVLEDNRELNLPAAEDVTFCSPFYLLEPQMRRLGPQM